jgi:alkylation response protein AidB-like acyl-CoA dehydrogenase
MFRLNAQQVTLRDTVRHFAREELAPLADSCERDGTIPEHIIARARGLGFFGMLVPPAHGGAGLDVVSYCVAVEELAVGLLGLTSIINTHTMVTRLLLQQGTEEQQAQFLPELASGQKLAAFALTEPDAGSDAASVSLRAEHRDAEYVLSGRKRFISNLEHAAYIAVVARADPKVPKHHGLSIFLVAQKSAGVHIGERWHTMGNRSTGTYDLVLEDCRVPASHRIGPEQGGFAAAMQALEVGRLNVAARCVGLARAAFERALDYAKERKQFGAPLAAFQATQFKLADMATQIEAARLLMYHAASKVNAGERATKAIAMAKLFASEMAVRCTDAAIQIHGGLGYTAALPLERYYRDARLFTIGEGTSEIQRLVIAKDLLR